MQLSARFRPHPRGFGFLHVVASDNLTATEVTVARDDGPAVTADRVFVPPPLCRGLIADDLVDARVNADSKGLTAETVTLRHRPRRMVVGTVANGPGRLVLEPDPSIGSGWLRLDPTMTDAQPLPVGRVVVTLIGDGDDGEPVGRALVAGPYVAGSPQAIRAASTVIALGRAAPDLIPGGAAAAGLEESTAALGHTRAIGLLASGRRGAAAGIDADGPIAGASLEPDDRRDEICVTIDSSTTKDIDDAVAAAWDGASDSPVDVAVHIADAAGVVGVNSPADEYARIVASTAYLAVGDNAPMLDPALSEQALSLLPGEDRQVLSVGFLVQPDGSIADVTVSPSLVSSRAKLTYPSVEQWLDGDDSGIRAEAGDYADDSLAALTAISEASRRLGVQRDSRITFEDLFAQAAVTPQLVDGKLTVVDAEPHERAYRVIERLMVATNEAVAGFLVSRQVPALYRTHAGLDIERLDRIRAAIELADVAVPAANEPEPSVDRLAAELLAAIDTLEASGAIEHRNLLVAVATSATARANYDTDPAHHRGLASHAYTHFTSPIRRYADLVVHRQVRAALAGEAAPYDKGTLASLAGWLDARAGALRYLQTRERNELWNQLLDRGYLDDEEPAVITALTANGIVVRLQRLGITGFITAERALGLPPKQRGSLVVDEHGLTTTSGPWQVGGRVHVRFVGLDDTGRTIWRLGR
ncbi:MAG: RNB domain-containing ribonuclease [Nitriliruptoraceae bacterium]